MLNEVPSAGEEAQLADERKEGVGEATGDRNLEAESRGRDAPGGVEGTAHNIKEKAEDLGEEAVGHVRARERPEQ